MIQNTNDVYNLIKSPEYTMPYIPESFTPYGKYSVRNNNGDRVNVTLGIKHIEISVFHNMNSVYYETISKSNADGKSEYKRFRELLFAKHIAAMVGDINKHYR